MPSLYEKRLSTSKRGRRTVTPTGSTGRTGRNAFTTTRVKPHSHPAARPSARTTSTILNALEETKRRKTNRETHLDRALETYGDKIDSDNDDLLDSDSPLIDLYVQQGGQKIFRSMTPFSHKEFERIWDKIAVPFVVDWNRGRGPKSKTTPKDAFFMLLSVLHLPTKWDNHGVTFMTSGQTAQKTVIKALKIAAPLCKANFVNIFSRDDYESTGIGFCQNYPETDHITDASITMINRPAGTHNEAKPYFSGKHKLYCLKVEASVYPNGMVCNWTKPYPGATSDITIFRDNLPFHKSKARKSAGALAVPDLGENSGGYPSHHAIMLDKGYQGIQDDVRAILPKKKPRGGRLTLEDKQRNGKISSDRVIIENFFGRASEKFGILAGKYTWDRDTFNLVIDVCFSLCNFHIMLHPLREQDGQYYKKVLATLKHASEVAIDRGRRRQLRYRQQRAAIRRAIDDDFDDDDDDGEIVRYEHQHAAKARAIIDEEEEEEEEEDDDDDEEDNVSDGQLASIYSYRYGKSNTHSDNDDDDDDDDLDVSKGNDAHAHIDLQDTDDSETDEEYSD